jgi:hypothetical protein
MGLVHLVHSASVTRILRVEEKCEFYCLPLGPDAIVPVMQSVGRRSSFFSFGTKWKL